MDGRKYTMDGLENGLDYRAGYQGDHSRLLADYAEADAKMGREVTSGASDAQFL
jgi:hypothetical protein